MRACVTWRNGSASPKGRRSVSQLEAAGVLTKVRAGRRNHYSIDERVPLRHPLESHKTVGNLLQLIATDDETIT